jgi:hypothetical protein
MRHALKELKENVHGLLESLFVGYANCLRADHPELKIRNATVLTSAIREFARLGYIELVDRRSGIPEDIPDFLVRAIKRVKHQPIWIPGPNFPDDPWDLYHQMKPSNAWHRNSLAAYTSSKAEYVARAQIGTLILP